jgi:hypothetical protein
MTPKGRIHAADKCQAETVELLRKAGWQVFIQPPLDLVCSKGSVTVFVELKNDHKCKLTKAEEKYIRNSQGLRTVGYGADDTLWKLNILHDWYVKVINTRV